MSRSGTGGDRHQAADDGMAGTDSELLRTVPTASIHARRSHRYIHGAHHSSAQIHPPCCIPSVPIRLQRPAVPAKRLTSSTRRCLAASVEDIYRTGGRALQPLQVATSYTDSSPLRTQHSPAPTVCRPAPSSQHSCDSHKLSRSQPTHSPCLHLHFHPHRQRAPPALPSPSRCS